MLRPESSMRSERVALEGECQRLQLLVGELLLKNHQLRCEVARLHEALDAKALQATCSSRQKGLGAPGLAFETWDPCNQFRLETPPSPLSSRAKPRDLQFPFTPNQCSPNQK
jgi:hypothetical protein